MNEATNPDDPTSAARNSAALLDPLREIYGVSDKVLTMALSGILIGASAGRPRWLEVGVQLIAVDTLVHNFLHRTGILTRLNAPHPYGSGCYRPGGCADIIRARCQQDRCPAVQPRLPEGVSPVRAARNLAVLQPARPRHLQRQPGR